MIQLAPFCRSSSVHRRHELGPIGDVQNRKVRMSNLIVQNLCTFLRVLYEQDRLYCLVLEQPGSSWLWKLEWVMALGVLLGCAKVHTWSLVSHYIHDGSVLCVFISEAC